MNNTIFRRSIIAVAVLGVSGCLGGAETKDSGTPTTSGSAAEFPIGLAVASPTARSTTSAARVIAAAMVSPTEAAPPGSGASGSQYEWATKKIGDLLAGTISTKDVFDANLLMQSAGRAECYGPTLPYKNHPDGQDNAPPPNSGFTEPNLPSGDLGIWQELGASGNACAAEELNMQLRGVSGRTIMGLMGLAGMVSVAKTANIALPSAGSSIDLLTQMNAAGIVNVTFTTATLALSADAATWDYTLAFTFAQPQSQPQPQPQEVGGGTKNHNVVLALKHKPGADDNSYEGILTYRADAEMMGGNCGSATGATNNGTLYYKRSSATDLLVNAREGGYCGTDISGATITDLDLDSGGTYQFLDPAAAYNNMSKPNGWANNFSMFSGKFNPSTQEGDYVYAWQAGSMDGATRVFQLSMNANSTDGEAYFGFGPAIGTTTGSIDGMICNWAGPGNSHTPQPYAQRQFISFNATSGKFEIPTGGSDIVFAPTNSCAYEGGSNFMYDRNLSGSADADDVVIVNSNGISTGPTNLGLDLMKKDTAATMQEAINARGFVLPPL